jgi:hypothetical protein
MALARARSGRASVSSTKTPRQTTTQDSREKKGNYKMKEVTRSGIGFGTALAIAISWSIHKSILWAIIHGAFSWFYVVYYWYTMR